MTVIVANHELIAADSRVTDEQVGDVRIFSSPKIFEKNGDLIGCAGDSINCENFLKWYGTRKKKPVFKSGSFSSVVLTKKGELYYYDEHLARDRITDPYIAIGSGGDAALGALHMGADPIRAVEVACLVNLNCGLPVQVMKLTPLVS